MIADEGGCSACPKGEERHEYWTSIVDGKTRVQYEYRTETDVLFTCVAEDLEEAREKLYRWIERGV